MAERSNFPDLHVSSAFHFDQHRGECAGNFVFRKKLGAERYSESCVLFFKTQMMTLLICLQFLLPLLQRYSKEHIYGFFFLSIIPRLKLNFELAFC